MPVPEALVIRTLPNGSNKQTMQYSGTNPPYITAEAMGWIAGQGVQHLLVDIPSVDREQDNGVLAAHHIFWNYPANPRLQATITEMVFIPNEIPDGLYLVNIQVPCWELDAAPSRIALFPLRQMP